MHVLQASGFWHGLGFVEDEPNIVDVRKRLGWLVGKEPSYTYEGLRTPYYHTVRDDLPRDDVRRVLGIVGDRYTPLQNSALCDLAEALCGEGGLTIEAAGALKGGKHVWLLAHDPGADAIKGDEVKRYLLLRNTHDGTGKLRIGFTLVRVVCWNTISAALRKLDSDLSLRHTASIVDRVAQAARAIQRAGSYFEGIEQRLGWLADQVVTPGLVDDVLHKTFPDNPNAKTTNKRTANARADVRRLFNGAQAGGSAPAAKGTAYGLYNALQEYRQYSYSEAPTRTQRETRLESVWFGSRAAARTSDMETIAGALAGVNLDGAAPTDVESALADVMF